ncbi:hypothetical protein ACJQW9_003271 [Salmonella enterica]|nr:hypothetical protein SEEN443_06694 [Salmonella enterica subsp. enterica serovar Newport str. CVM 19443]EJA84244.1 hypothetical protein SEEN536_05051 [Salmonella enterica subsp. enterica serovar Newport str. CVM 19536]EJA90065.1 hypothetical protein SEEN470_08464 [Salmonella enterica subsp. enterica serovar Newport str. CVM 19470]EJA94894.1 hypothetical protein SEEN176_23917 [Salmonella enterica subsp. enterica serovar Newport str. CVM 4176]EMG66109.1 hypothetical protein G207_13058 [Salmonel
MRQNTPLKRFNEEFFTILTEKSKRYRLVNMLPCAQIFAGQEADGCSK